CVALPAVAALRPASDTRPETIFANSSRVRRDASAGSAPPLIVCFARIAGTYNAAIRSPPSDESPANDSGSANATGNSYCPVCTRTPPLAHTADSAALICDDVTATVTAGRWRSHDSEIAFGDTSDHAASATASASRRSEEHTSELQSRFDLVCRLLLEKKTPRPHCHIGRAHR